MDAAKDIHKEVLPIWAVVELLILGVRTPETY
jgi:hypothetical protein